MFLDTKMPVALVDSQSELRTSSEVPSNEEEVRNGFGDDISLSKQTFDRLITKVFAKFVDPNNTQYFLEKKWLSSTFEKILKNSKTSNAYSTIYNNIRSLYLFHPFDLETHVTNFFHKFFINRASFEDQFASEKLKNYFTREGIDKSVKEYFVPLFNKFFVDERKGDNKIVNIKEFITMTLHTTINNYLRSLSLDYQMKNDSHLFNWIVNDFNYHNAKRLGLTKTYDAFFANKTEEEKITISFVDFSTQLETELLASLKSKANPLNEVVSYYLFKDLLVSEQIRAIQEKGSLSDAELVINSLYNPIDRNDPSNLFIANLEPFLIGIRKALTSFNFHWQNGDDSSGLVIKKDEPYDWLTAKDQTESNYEFRFRFEFVTRYVTQETSLDNADIYGFKIDVERQISAFEKAKNVVNNFIKSIVWNKGYMKQPEWTEKDIVAWAFGGDASTFKSKLEDAIKQESSVFISLNNEQWSGFSSISLEQMDFTTIDSNDFVFRVVPMLEIGVEASEFSSEGGYSGSRTPSYVGNNRIILSLRQYPKATNAIELLDPIRKTDIEVKEKTNTLSMLELIHRKVAEKFPNFFNFNKWEEQNLTFWLNEFLDEDGNSIPSLKSANDYLKRSNYIVFKSFLDQLAKRMNNDYHNSFVITPVLEIVKNTNLPGARIDSGLTFRDELFAKTKSFVKSLYTNKMNVFGDIQKGEFQGTKGLDVIFRDKLKKANPLPTTIQPKPQIGELLPDTFTFNLDGEEITFSEILGNLRESGFSNVQSSPVGWELEDDSTDYINYVLISYEIRYHNFATGEAKVLEQSFKLYINFEGVSQDEIERGYKNILDNIPLEKKGDEKLLKQVDDVFADLKNPDASEWRKDVSRDEYDKVIQKAVDLIAEFRPNDNIIKQIEEIYDNKVPSKIVSRFSNSEYLRVYEEILKYKDDFSKINVRKILENDMLLKFFQEQSKTSVKDWIIKTLKVSKNAKYTYFGASVGLGTFGLLAGVTSLRSLRLNIKARATNTKFKKSRLITILSLGASAIAICGSVALMLLFFIEKGGF